MSKRQRLCEKRGAKHYGGRVADLESLFGKVHTCLTKQEADWLAWEREHWRTYGCPPEPEEQSRACLLLDGYEVVPRTEGKDVAMDGVPPVAPAVKLTDDDPYDLGDA
jgi:hypothetical protein